MAEEKKQRREMARCSLCGDSYDYSMESCEISPCNCTVHRICFLEVSMQNISLDLPPRCTGRDCQVPFDISLYKYFCRRTVSNVEVPVRRSISYRALDPPNNGDDLEQQQHQHQQEEGRSIPVTKLNLGLTPYQCYFLDDSIENRNDSCLLSILYQRSHIDLETQGMVEEPSVLLESIINPTGVSVNTDTVLQYIMQFLNIAAVKSAADIVPPIFKSIDDVVLGGLQSQSLIFRMVYTLCTKQIYIPNETTAVADLTMEMRTDLIMVYFITELILKMEKRNRSSGSGVSKFLTDQLEINRVSQNLWQSLTSFRIVGSIHTVARKKNEALLPDGLAGLSLTFTPPKYGICVLSYDNIGFKKKAGYEQCVAMFWSIIPFLVLLKAGLYSTSRERKPKESALTASHHFLPDIEDYQVLGLRSRLLIKMILQEILPGIPPNARIDAFNELNVERNTDVPHRLPVSVRSSLVDAPGAPIIPTILADIEVDLNGEELEEANSHYESNYTQQGRVTWRDLNSLDCQKAIGEHAIDVTHSTQATGSLLTPEDRNCIGFYNLRWNELTNKLEWVNPDDCNDIKAIEPLQSEETLMIGDGAPTYGLLTLQDQGQLDVDLYNSIGGFHEYLESYRMWGRMFRDSHLEVLVGYWRDSKGKLDWFLEPSDPSQVEEESWEYLVAHYVVAIRACAEYHGSQQVSVGQVEAFMISRASQQIAVFDILLGIRFLEAIMMIRDSEDLDGKEGFELFSRGQHIITLLFAVTNAFKYVRINNDERFRWAFASDMQKEIHERYIFQKKTRFGKNIFADRMMEWFVKDVRHFEGKHMTSGKKTSVGYTVHQLGEWTRQRVQSSSASVRARNRRGVSTVAEARDSQHLGELSDNFRKAMKGIISHNIWGPGPVKAANNKNLAPTSLLCGDECNLEYIDMLKHAEDRIKKYSRWYLADNQINSHVQGPRKLTDDDFSHIRSSKTSVIESLTFLHRRETEMCPEALNTVKSKTGNINLVTCNYMATKLNTDIYRNANNDIPVMARLNKLSKQDLITLLVATRKILFTNQENIPVAPSRDTIAVAQLQKLEEFLQHPIMSPRAAGCNTEWLNDLFVTTSRVDEIINRPLSAFEKAAESAVLEDSNTIPTSRAVEISELNFKEF